MKNVLLLLLLLCNLNQTAYSGDKCTEAIGIVHNVIRENSFIVNRDLNQYIYMYGNEFAARLAALGRDGHWIDMGAGEGVAIQQFKGIKLPDRSVTAIRDLASIWKGFISIPTLIKLKWAMSRSPEDKPFVTGITYTSRTGFNPEIQKANRLRWLTGRYFQDIPDAEIRPADIITDPFGILMYSHDPDVVLRRYVKLLKPGGVIFISAGKVSESYFDRSNVELKSGETVTLLQWLKSIQGIKLTTLHSSVSGRAIYHMKIEKIPGQEPVIPKLELIDFISPATTGYPKLFKEI